LVSFTLKPLYPLKKETQIPNESAPEPACTTWRGEKSSSYRDSNSDPSAVQSLYRLRYAGREMENENKEGYKKERKNYRQTSIDRMD
jgi:hypothetical protein